MQTRYLLVASCLLCFFFVCLISSASIMFFFRAINNTGDGAAVLFPQAISNLIVFIAATTIMPLSLNTTASPVTATTNNDNGANNLLPAFAYTSALPLARWRPLSERLTTRQTALATQNRPNAQRQCEFRNPDLQFYNIGDHWIVTVGTRESSSCLECSCTEEAQVKCLPEHECPKLIDCEHTFQPADQCCPICTDQESHGMRKILAPPSLYGLIPSLTHDSPSASPASSPLAIESYDDQVEAELYQARNSENDDDEESEDVTPPRQHQLIPKLDNQPENCVHNGHTYLENQSWSPRPNTTSITPADGDTCVQCFCYRGNALCYAKFCTEHRNCPQEHIIPPVHDVHGGECCPKCRVTPPVPTTADNTENVRRFSSRGRMEPAIDRRHLSFIARQSFLGLNADEPTVPATPSAGVTDVDVSTLCISGRQVFRFGQRWHPKAGPFGVLSCINCECVENGEIECFRRPCLPIPNGCKNIVKRTSDGGCCEECADASPLSENDVVSENVTSSSTSNQQNFPANMTKQISLPVTNYSINTTQAPALQEPRNKTTICVRRDSLMLLYRLRTKNTNETSITRLVFRTIDSLAQTTPPLFRHLLPLSSQNTDDEQEQRRHKRRRRLLFQQQQHWNSNQEKTEDGEEEELQPSASAPTLIAEAAGRLLHLTGVVHALDSSRAMPPQLPYSQTASAQKFYYVQWSGQFSVLGTPEQKPAASTATPIGRTVLSNARLPQLVNVDKSQPMFLNLTFGPMPVTTEQEADDVIHTLHTNYELIGTVRTRRARRFLRKVARVKAEEAHCHGEEDRSAVREEEAEDDLQLAAGVNALPPNQPAERSHKRKHTNLHLCLVRSERLYHQLRPQSVVEMPDEEQHQEKQEQQTDDASQRHTFSASHKRHQLVLEGSKETENHRPSSLCRRRNQISVSLFL